jgi:hypothetical protein
MESCMNCCEVGRKQIYFHVKRCLFFLCLGIDMLKICEQITRTTHNKKQELSMS